MKKFPVSGVFIALLFSVALVQTASAQNLGTALVNGAPQINSGRVEGNVQQMTGTNATLNSGAVITGDLLVPGTPTLIKNGQYTFGGVIVGTGSPSPSNYQVILNGSVTLGHLRTRTNPVAIPARTGTANVSFPNRTKVARDNGCDVYVSIHFNGVETAPLRRHPFGMWDQHNNLNSGEDSALAILLRQKVQTAIEAVEPEASRNAPTDGITTEQHEANNQKRLDTLSDYQNNSTDNPDYNGNTPGYTPCRAALVEMEWISNTHADVLFNEGSPNLSATADRMREEAAKALADGSIEDLRAAPSQ